MANQVVRQRTIGIAREDDATKGTSVALTTGMCIQVEDGVLEAMTEQVQNESSAGRIEAGNETFVTKEWTELRISGPVKADFIGHILTGLLGTVTSANSSGETLVRDHNIVVNNNVDAPAYTIYMLGQTVSEKATYGTWRRLTLKAQAGGILNFEADGVAQAIESATGTAAYSTDHHFHSGICTIKFASATSGLGAASAITFNELELNIERDVYPHFVFGSKEPNKFVAGSLRITGKLKILHTGITYRDYFTDETDRAMSIDFNDTAVTIGSAESPELKITLDKINITSHKNSSAADDVHFEEIELKAHYDLDEGTPRMVAVLLVNEESTTAYTEPA